jgi:hypothetical protein
MRRRQPSLTAVSVRALCVRVLQLFLVIVWPIRAMSGAHLDDVSVRAVVDGRFSECFHMPNFLALPNAQFLCTAAATTHTSRAVSKSPVLGKGRLAVGGCAG